MTRRVRGIDTTFLVQLEVSGHPGHQKAQVMLEDVLGRGDPLALAPQVLSELLHVVTDPRRFERPLSMGQALARAEAWWWAPEVLRCLPNNQTTGFFLKWMNQHRLGRKRLLDTQLAATYFSNDVQSILTTNARDFQVFGCFEVMTP
jgi:predicted nucleic acid-binding protein